MVLPLRTHVLVGEGSSPAGRKGTKAAKAGPGAGEEGWAHSGNASSSPSKARTGHSGITFRTHHLVAAWGAGPGGHRWR